MKIVKGWAMPDFDEQFPLLLDDHGHYQFDNLKAAVKHCKQRRTVIDGGAHIGTWSAVFAGLFESVLAFEPSPDTFACLQHNVTADNVQLRQQALGAEPGRVRMTLEGFEGTKRETNAGSRYAVAGDDAEQITIDSLGLTDLDLLKLDIEGGEVHALMGARDTLIRCRPVVLFENKFEWKRHGFRENEPHRFLKRLGARKLAHAGIDEIWGWQ